MEVLNPIYMGPNMTACTRMMKHDGVDKTFPFSKRDISE